MPIISVHGGGTTFARHEEAKQSETKQQTMHHGGYVYILCSNNRKVLYTGVTSDLRKRIHEHRSKHYSNSFTSKYNCSNLIYYCFYERIEMAIAEEKRIKGGNRQQKINLINTMNVDWRDLWEEVQHWD
jgi:putative endonuclease